MDNLTDPLHVSALLGPFLLHISSASHHSQKVCFFVFSKIRDDQASVLGCVVDETCSERKETKTLCLRSLSEMSNICFLNYHHHHLCYQVSANRSSPTDGVCLSNILEYNCFSVCLLLFLNPACWGHSERLSVSNIKLLVMDSNIKTSVCDFIWQNEFLCLFSKNLNVNMYMCRHELGLN